MIDATIVGLGRWGKTLVNSVQGKSDKIRFVRCVVRNPEGAHEYAAELGLDVSTDYERTLRDDRIQAVVLATPHSLHLQQILAAAAAGRAVFCEKPLTLSKTDAQRAVEACTKAGVPLGLGHDKRFWPSMHELKQTVSSDKLGEILHIEGHFSNESTRRYYTGWRGSAQDSPGAGLTATGIHVLDAFVNLAGPIGSTHAHLVTRPPDPSLVDTLSVFLKFRSEVTGVLCCVRTTPQFWRVHVFGKNGSAEAVEGTGFVLRKTDSPPRNLSFEPVDTRRLELEAFADAVSGRAPYPITPQQMIDCVAALEATIKSIEIKAPVAIEA